MYKVTVKSRGKYDNATLGARYCFTKRSAVELAVSFTKFECDFTVEKFVCLHSDIFAWSDVEVCDKIWDKVYEILDEEQEEGG